MRGLAFVAIVAIAGTVWSVTERMPPNEVFDAVFWLLSGGLWFYITEVLVSWAKEFVRVK